MRYCVIYNWLAGQTWCQCPDSDRRGERRESRYGCVAQPSSAWLSVTWRDKNLDKQFLVDTKITTSDLGNSAVPYPGGAEVSYGLDLIKHILIIMERRGEGLVPASTVYTNERSGTE